MVSEKLNLWYCDTFVAQPWQFFFLVLPLAGAFLYGRDQKKIAWILIGAWVVIQVTLSALTNFVFNCNME
ncbi:hypothetical protein OGR47_08535 [Methylocystis sp. MJC1]|jgi:nucleoside permease NupC|uniref:hypothetical protein n=1 Tax=Methylocystis sp. MJC1 TaxID=2654282 RepID=UPI0013EC847F|nr:hypothetical protein [Methylocystis sp. MJC1]KAF2991729.1 hypothetical protein MJC1_01294 [Methylocystis sp. MJC1]MBU6527032.1 hypothetical protein [Methylocystis sp. MJC1]UZX13470.1 hypothetical protein OGR47_08535 [Methylocystis sp. MJC1]